MYKKIVFVLFFISSFASAQEIIKGTVTDKKKATIIWRQYCMAKFEISY